MRSQYILSFEELRIQSVRVSLTLAVHLFGDDELFRLFVLENAAPSEQLVLVDGDEVELAQDEAELGLLGGVGCIERVRITLSVPHYKII